MACDEIWLQLTSGNDTQEVLLATIDFRGWQFREVRLDQLPDGKSYRVSAIKVARKSPFFSDSGSFFLDNMLVYTSSGIPTIATSKGIKVYPNPVSDILNVQSETPISGIALYNLSGYCIATSPDAAIEVSDIPSGTYLLKVKTEGNDFCYPVLITH